MSLTLPRPGRTTTGVDELTEVRTVSPVPEHLRVSVFGPRQQIDITLPADARVADVLPYLTRLIARHESAGVDAATTADEPTARSLLRRAAPDGVVLPAAETLREAGVRQGDMLYLDSERTLVPPTLHDDVVDAAAQLNRAAYAAWGRQSAAAMTCLALYACVGVLVWMSSVDRFQSVRPVIVGIDVVAVLALLTAATVSQRMHGAQRVAAACSWAAVLLIGAALWSGFAGWAGWGPVVACTTLPLIAYGCYRLVGTGRWGLLAGSVFAALTAVVVTARAVTTLPQTVLGVLTSLGALALCGLVPRLTTGTGRARRTGKPYDTKVPDAFDDPFRSDDGATRVTPVDTLPSAEEVVARGQRAAEIRAGLYAGAGATVILGAAMTLGAATGPRWPALVFVTLCAVVLALRVRSASSAAERSGVLAAAAVTALSATVSATTGSPAFAVTGLAALAAMVAAGAGVGVFADSWHAVRVRLKAALDALDYLCVAALIPAALAVVDGYARVRDSWP